MKAVAALGAATLVLTLSTGCAPAARPSPSPIFIAVDQGYLAPDALVRLAGAIPSTPVTGSAQDLTDHAASAGFVALEDSDRWLLATAHAELRPPLALQHFDCALGVRLGSAETPALDRMAARAFHDARAAAALAGARGQRARPVAEDPARRACQTLTPEARRSSAYPSTAAVVGTVYAEALARISPQQAGPARRIGHEIGVSRLVCAMDYPSDVAAGEALGRAVMAEIAATPAFQAEVVAARAEIEAARATGRTNPGCAAERAALAVRLP
ncbi:PA-phosphatase [Brevundimonas sp. SL130]|uniref:PA-phosphatase n=1 Tax=Brevundimonas sp. SL130 TaxID=2995143 RepID=UPI00226C73AA|nr:PA-phosphatase [Brevundimonas sp. SL130]WAC60366.1 PA-phosphatase [Brevundimonas sp. SL130]